MNLKSNKYRVFAEIGNNPYFTLRKIAVALKLKESVVENLLSQLIDEGYLEENAEILGPNSMFVLSDKGKEFFNKYGVLTIEEISATHDWKQIGSHGDGAGMITRDKWYPMGSICKKCGLHTGTFNMNPTICPNHSKE